MVLNAYEMFLKPKMVSYNVLVTTIHDIQYHIFSPKFINLRSSLVFCSRTLCHKDWSR